MPSITVVIPAYNYGAYVAEAIDSVLGQTRMCEQIIVVDDCSTDRTSEIVKSYGDLIDYHRMQNNSGVLPAVLAGLKLAKGDIISFLDADDIWEARKLEMVEECFVSDPNIGIVTHSYFCIDGRSRRIPYHSDTTYKSTAAIHRLAKGDKVLESKLLEKSLLSYKGLWLGSAWSFLRTALDYEGFVDFVNHVPLQNYLRLTHQDQPLAAYIVLNADISKKILISYIDLNLLRYRIHGSNSSGAISTANAARRSVKRSVATVYGTALLVGFHPDLIEENKCQQLRLAYAEYLDSLYSTKNISLILSKFLSAAVSIPFSRYPFEIVRFFMVYFLGLTSFLRIKSIFTLHK